MTEAQLYEKVGRMQVAVETQSQAYDQLLQLLAGVVGGAVDASRVMVNLTARGWTLAPDGFRPELPATVNGLPQCVTAPASSDLLLAREQLAAAEREIARLTAAPIG